ncbi:MAG: helix-turn-helix domain-containing protein [Planctomycetes bacterium]|nr:helix-turn-helix domain-containing protein [Planctomycetota bacterium]
MPETIIVIDPRLLTIDAVAQLLGCSSRHVRRLADSDRMPPPLRLGTALRWDRKAVEKWIEAGCPPVERRGGRA